MVSLRQNKWKQVAYPLIQKPTERFRDAIHQGVVDEIQDGQEAQKNGSNGIFLCKKGCENRD